MKIIEKSLLIGIVIAILLRIFLVPGAGALIVLLFSFLFLLYFIFGFLIFNNIPLGKVFKRESYLNTTIWKIIGAILTGIALSVTIIGVLFKVQSWPGSSIIFTTGFFFLFIIFCITAFYVWKNKAEYYKRITGKIVLIGLTGLLIILVPEEIKVKVFYRNHPKFVEALLQAFKDPKNPEVWERVDEEREAMKNEDRNSTQ